MKILITVVLFTLCAHTVSGAGDAGHSRLISNDEDDCLPVSEFGLESIRLYQPHEKVIQLLGDPKKISYSSGEDDGGGYRITILSYPTMTIEMVRGLVDRIVTKSPLQPTPEGIRVGDSRSTIVKKLGATPRNWKQSDTKLWITTCFTDEQPREDYVIYTMNTKDQVSEIAYESNRP